MFPYLSANYLDLQLRCLAQVQKNSALIATFIYDGDGKQVKSIVNGVTTFYVGNHYELKNSVVTKYYFAGATRLAVRTGTTLSYLLSDHLSSSSLTTDANGIKTAQALYKAFGESRYTFGNLGTDYKFTGQREEASFGLYFFNARWFDPSIGRSPAIASEASVTSPDTIVPTSTQGTRFRQHATTSPPTPLPILQFQYLAILYLCSLPS